LSDLHHIREEQIHGLIRYATALTRDAETAEELVEDTVREALAGACLDQSDPRVRLLTILHDLRGNPFRDMIGAGPVMRAPAATLTLSDLDRALGELSEEQRAIILLVGLEGLSSPEAAAVLRLTPSTLRSRLPRARAELRRLMGVGEAARQTRPATRQARRRTSRKTAPCAERIAA